MDYKQETVSHQERRDHSASVHESVNRISLIVGVLVTIAMIFDNHSITRSTIAGVSFYGLVAGMLIMAPHVTQMAIAHMHEVTTRRYNELPYASTQHAQDAHNRLSVVQPLQLDYTRPVEAPRLPASAAFVPAVPKTPDVVKVDAANFVTQLFDTVTGQPLSNKITPNKGQIQHKSPSPDAVEYLLALEIVKRGEGQQLYYNRDLYAGYPTLREAINAISTGVRKASWRQGEEQEGRVLAGEVAQ